MTSLRSSGSTPADGSAPTPRPSSSLSQAMLARRLRRANALAATAFLIGGSLFALGAALAQSGVDATTCATIYLVGGAFFSTGGYTVGAPGRQRAESRPAGGVLALV